MPPPKFEAFKKQSKSAKNWKAETKRNKYWNAITFLPIKPLKNREIFLASFTQWNPCNKEFRAYPFLLYVEIYSLKIERIPLECLLANNLLLLVFEMEKSDRFLILFSWDVKCIWVRSCKLYLVYKLKTKYFPELWYIYIWQDYNKAEQHNSPLYWHAKITQKFHNY